MRTRLIFSVAFLAVTLGLWAQEFDLSSSSNLDLNSTPNPLGLSTRLDGGFTQPFDLRGGGFEFRAHVQGTFVPSPVTLGADVDVLTLTFAYQKPTDDLKSLLWTLGRFTVGEPTGLILNHAGDGSKLSFDYGWANLSVSALYTGFVSRASSGVALTLADLSSIDKMWASPRFVGSVEGSFTAFGSQRVTLSALAQQDLNSKDKLTPEWSNVFTGDNGGTLDTQYLTLKVDGPLADRLSYEGFGTFGSGSTLSWLESPASRTGFTYEYTPIVSYLIGGSVTYLAPQVASMAVSARVIAASGDPDLASPVEGNTKAASTAFVPITPGSLGTVFSPALSNLLYYELGATASPIPGLPLDVGAKVLGFQRSVSGVVVAPGVLRTGPGWIGQELDLTGVWRPFSDLTVTCSAGAFVPTSGTYAPGSKEAGLQYAVKTGVTLSL